MAASKVSATGEVILKLVNVSEKDSELTVDLPGIGNLSSTAKGWVLTGQLLDQNSVDQPDKVTPKAITVTGVGPSFKHVLPAHSLTVLRLQPAGHSE